MNCLVTLRAWSRMLCRGLAAATLCFAISSFADEASDWLTLAVDALTRLEGVDLNANPTLKERILKVLEKARGTPNFVRLVRHFSIKGQDAGLLEVATAFPKDESGVEAMKLVLNGWATNAVELALSKGGSNAVAIAEALGNTGLREAVPLLSPVVTSTNVGTPLRSQAIRSLARTVEGARDLLSLVQAEKLSGDLRKLAIDELSQVRWEAVQTEAAKLRAPAGAWPPVSELIKRTGDLARGEAVYRRTSPGCINCHVVKGQGIELGPNLSEIGSKLGKDALYQAILEPSAGISFGYEAFTVTLKNGDEAYGLIASETADELTLKAAGGILSRHKKSDIASRQKSTLSMMPAGLEGGVTPAELVDLVEFLVSLKKPN